LVNRTYGLSGRQAMRAITASASPRRVVPEVEEHLRLLPPSIAEFSHYDPAVFLTENGSAFADAPGMTEALDRFQRLFSDFNALLPKAESVAA